MLLFRRFDATDTRPELIQDREAEVDWLVQSGAAFLGAADGTRGLCPAITGEKGVGKTIIARRALFDLRGLAPGRLFVDVDCRGLGSARRALECVADGVVKELERLRKDLHTVPAGAMDTAQIFASIARFDDAELSVVHEHVLKYKAAIGLGGGHAFLSQLKTSFDVSLEREWKDARTLSGKVRFDDVRTIELARRMFADLAENAIATVLLLDNVDELLHDYRDEATRNRVRGDVQTLLRLQDAPIALPVCTRNYFDGVLSRKQLNKRKAIERLPPKELKKALTRRLEEEPANVKEALGVAEAKEAIARLADLAPTPLAFFQWFQWMAEREKLRPDSLGDEARAYVKNTYAGIEEAVVHAVVLAFEGAGSTVPEDRLLEACRGSRPLMDQVRDRQVVLPVDFWNPVQFTLDPDLHWLHAVLRGP